MSSIIQNKFHDVIGDAARTSKFNFILPPLQGLTSNTDAITYSVKGLTLPKMEHTPINIMHKGRPIPIRGTTKFSQQFTVTFYMHENHIVKRFFESWMALIEQRHYYYDPRKQERVQRGMQGVSEELPPYMTWYNVDAWIEQRNFDGDNVTALYEIKNVFPINVEPPSYDYSQVGTIGEQTVTFAYSHYMLHSKPLWSGNLVNQLHATTQRQEGFKEYTYDENRHRLFNNFQGLEQTAAQGASIFWRPYELARWDNQWNRWREANGENQSPGSEPPKFDPDTI